MERFTNWRHALLAFSVVVSGCNGLSTTHAPTPGVANTSRVSGVEHSSSLANKQILVVSTVDQNQSPASLTTFPADANGTPTPLRKITGSKTHIIDPWRGVISDDGRLWVVNQLKPEKPGDVLEFSSSANGDVHPSTIVGCLGNMDGGTIGLDPQGFVYVAGTNSEVDIYAPVTGCASPVSKIIGPHTLLNGPFISVDATGNVYSANFWSNSVTVYAAGSTGDVSPIRDISGPKTHLDRPSAVGIDANGDIFVLNLSDPSPFKDNVLVFGPGATGDVAPIREIRGSSTRLVHSASLAVSSDGWVFVANFRASYGLITVFAPGADGNVAPTHTINGSSNSFSGFPIGIAIQP
jgi:hypothetical protein